MTHQNNFVIVCCIKICFLRTLNCNPFIIVLKFDKCHRKKALESGVKTTIYDKTILLHHFVVIITA